MKRRRQKGTGSVQAVKRNGKTYYYGKFAQKTYKLDATNKADARRQLDELVKARLVAEAKDENEPTLQRIGLLWHDYRFRTGSRLSTGSSKSYEIYMKKFADFCHENYSSKHFVYELPAHAFQEFYNSLEGKSVCYKKSIVTFLKFVWTTLEITPNPWEKIRLPTRSQTQVVKHGLLTDEMLDKIFSVVEGEEKTLCLIGLHTALRISDARALRWESIDWTPGRETITATPKKTRRFGKTVEIPMSRALMENLLPIRKDSGLVLPHLGSISDVRITLRMQDIFKRAGIDEKVKVEGCDRERRRYSFHSFRVTYITRALEAGVPLNVVESIAGHSSDVMTLYYTRLNRATKNRFRVNLDCPTGDSKDFIEHKWKELKSLLPECEEREEIGRLVKKILKKI